MSSDPYLDRELCDTRQAERLREMGSRRPHLVELSDTPCVYCGLKATRGEPATCWKHRDLPPLDGPYGGVFV